ncbi:MAG: cache domain-containing protein [Candidatus Kapabacteria bacterium]|jgi:CBS domain-containing protein|nr:cache domain-containing protein [Candidatus Kapabacteria bacterium]
MKISEHAASSEKQVGIRGEDIHEWIDGFFDYDGLRQFLKKEQQPGYDPYGHRHYRHCYEALEDAYIEFENKYSRDDIKAVFECHIKDDYDGYLPTREDFINGTFKDKYHEEEDIGMRDSVLSRKELKQYFQGKRYSQFKAPERKLNSLFRLKIIMPTVIAVILFISSVFAIIIPTFRSNIIDRKKEMIKELTAAASSLIEEKIRMNESGQLRLEEAQKLALSEIQDMRYGPENKDYFWITDMKPLMLMHPYRTELIGSDLTGYKDIENKSGKNLFVEFVKMVESDGEGYLQYLWQWKDDSTRVVPKLSYVRGIPEWGWIIGTGIYINDVTDEIVSMSDKLIIIFLIISAFLIVLMTYVIMQSLKIDTELIKAESGLREANSRYRALVEVSNEGHVMLMDGVNIFSNHTMKKMLGLTEKEIMGTDLNELLPADLPMNKSAIEKLEELVRGNIQTTEFEGQIRTGDKIVDVIISTAKIFFAGNNGCIVSFRPNVRRSENFMLESFGGTRFHPGVLFMAKKASELCTKNITTVRDKKNTA